MHRVKTFPDPPFDVDRHSTADAAPVPWGDDWEPDPVEAMHQTGHWRRRLDLLSMLVSIYGSKKAFLIEYKQLLSQRLLKKRSFHISRELRNLELLKLRFGEPNLQECEVSLVGRDMFDVFSGNSSDIYYFTVSVG